MSAVYPRANVPLDGCQLLMLWTAPPTARKHLGIGCRRGDQDPEELIMLAITTIGLDIAKSIFQVHGVDAQGGVVVRRQLKRRYVLAFFKKLTPVSSASKPAPPRIIGRASCRLSGISCGSSLRPT
jgi:hypothetical protein